MSINLINGDCLELMKGIPDGSVDLILTDPPYGTTACKWDTVIDFDLMWEQLKRIIKPNGAIVLFGSEPFSSLLRVSNLRMFKYDWIWEKNRFVGFLNCKNAPLKAYEHIHVFSEGSTANGSKKNMPYHPQGLTKVNRKRVNKAEPKDSVVGNRPSRNGEYLQKFEGYPTSILKYNSDSSGEQLHPTQKPVALLEYLIKTYTQEKETVLDFTMGSGSTGVACKNTNRSFIGIELDENYFNIANERINKAQGETK